MQCARAGLGELLSSGCGHHPCHQVDSVGVVEPVLSYQRAPGPEPDRVSDRRSDAHPLPPSLSPAPHQRGVDCPELTLEALDSRSDSRYTRHVSEHVVEHRLSSFIPVVEVCESKPQTLAWIFDFEPWVRTRRRVEGCPVHRASAKQGLLVPKVAVDSAALDPGLLGHCRHCGHCRADGTVKLHRRLGDS